MLIKKKCPLCNNALQLDTNEQDLIQNRTASIRCPHCHASLATETTSSLLLSLLHFILIIFVTNVGYLTITLVLIVLAFIRMQLGDKVDLLILPLSKQEE